MHIFVDESGSFPTRTRVPERGLAIAALAVMDNTTLRQMCTRLRKGYRTKVPRAMRGRAEISCSSAPDSLRRYVFRKLIKEQAVRSGVVDVGWRAIAPSDLLASELYEQPILYPTMVIPTIEKVLPDEAPQHIAVTLDHFLSQPYRPAVIDAIERVIRNRFGDFPRIEARFASSQSVPGLQMVDYLVWAVRRAVEGDYEWGNLLGTAMGRPFGFMQRSMTWNVTYSESEDGVHKQLDLWTGETPVIEEPHDDGT